MPRSSKNLFLRSVFRAAGESDQIYPPTTTEKTQTRPDQGALPAAAEPVGGGDFWSMTTTGISLLFLR